MQETAREYARRVLGYQKQKNPMSILSSSPRKIARLIRGVPRKKLFARPGPGAWSVAEILAHLADAEMVIGFRLRLILGSNGTPMQAYDQDEWARYAHYAKQDPGLSLDSFRVQRGRNVRLLKILPGKMWRHYGMHSERGKETVKRVVEMTAGHDINHMRQIERIVRGG